MRSLNLERQIRERVLPALRTFMNVPESEDEFVKACLNVIEDPAQPLPGLEVFGFLVNLPRASVTDQEWLLGRRLINQWFDSVSVVERKGRRETWPDRVLIFSYLECRVQIFSSTPEEAVSLAAQLFHVPPGTLARWYLKKHEYHDERKLAKNLVEFNILRMRQLDSQRCQPE